MRTKGEQTVIEVEGNNGGSFIRLEHSPKDGFCFLSVGHDCVHRVDREIKVVELAELLSNALDPC